MGENKGLFSVWRQVDSVSIGLLVFITSFGFLIRILGVLNSAFPLNDGGLFYMIRLM